MTSVHVREALAYCGQVTRTHSSTFHLGALLFPSRQRSAVMALYAACRAGDDAVDEAPDRVTAQRRLEEWWQGITRCYAGRPAPGMPIELALTWVLDGYDVPLHAFEELHAGLRSDLDACQPANLAELLLYCRRVGGVVGLMVTSVAGYVGGDATLDDAVALGQAMQLTNVLRDVGEDLDRGRLYLPADLMRRYGVEESRLRAGLLDDRYVELLKCLAQLALDLYGRGWQSLPRLQGRAAWAVGLAALNYQGILGKLERNGWDNLSRRAFLLPRERLALLPATACRLALAHTCQPAMRTLEGDA